MSTEDTYALERIFHDAERVLEVRFQGELSRDSIAEVFELLRDPRFTMQHHLLVNLAGVKLGFSIDDVAIVASAIELSPAQRPRGARTAWVLDNHTNTEIVRLARAFAPRWHTVWKFVNDRESAFAWLASPELGPVDFEEKNFSL